MVVIFLIVILFACAGFLIYNLNSGNEKTLEAFALPAANKIILIDPGHGGIDAGASFGELKEKDINLDIALKLQKLVEESGGVVYLTRAEDVSTQDKNRDKSLTQKKSDLIERKKAIERYNADVFLSIHMNKFSDSKYSGAQIFYPKDENSRRLAEIMQNTLRNVLDKNNKRKAKEDNKIFVLKDNKVPSVLIECGFLSNEAEREKFKTESFRQKTAWAIFVGLNEFFSGVKN